MLTSCYSLNSFIFPKSCWQLDVWWHSEVGYHPQEWMEIIPVRTAWISWEGLLYVSFTFFCSLLRACPPVSYISLLHDASLRTPYFSVSRIVRNKSLFFIGSPVWGILLNSYGHCWNCLLQWQHLWATENSRAGLYTTDKGSVLPAVSPGIMVYIFKGHISTWSYLVPFKD